MYTRIYVRLKTKMESEHENIIRDWHIGSHTYITILVNERYNNEVK